MDRKRLMRWASFLVLGAGILFVGRTCHAENADVTFVFSRGAGPPIEAFAVALIRDQDVVGNFGRTPGASATGELARWTLDLDPGGYTLEIELTVGGETRRVAKRVEALARATIRIDLSDL